MQLARVKERAGLYSLFQYFMLNSFGDILTLAEDYSIVHWRFIYSINLHCELLVFSVNHSMV